MRPKKQRKPSKRSQISHEMNIKQADYRLKNVFNIQAVFFMPDTESFIHLYRLDVILHGASGIFSPNTRENHEKYRPEMQ